MAHVIAHYILNGLLCILLTVLVVILAYLVYDFYQFEQEKMNKKLERRLVRLGLYAVNEDGIDLDKLDPGKLNAAIARYNYGKKIWIN